MRLLKAGAHVINVDQVAWIEVFEGRPTVHFAGGETFRPRTEEEAAALHALVTESLIPAGAQVAAYKTWGK
jgi:hypothetical protein